ncbi:uncharacterized protein GGS22DRAFT_22221 [Annulohypoxylon maeteangense]|uniref:uncharacterized protein n=1 Tax=Annulohypoxylon maeteangense TaxID=1927788 RepID=UPI002007B3F7|nr:uncharacterized protein GGS22DRAFT_22221 [Annulohypoxylon maeteangense]KAI0884332.1 hypothetical protein GGS22DRAFT_22221 [Annulohypoxylon maeteangense]
MESGSSQTLATQQSTSKSNDHSRDHSSQSVERRADPPELLSPRNTLPRKVSKIGTSISSTWKLWKWEIIVSFLAPTVVIIIFATLYPHDGRPMPEWPLRISVNALLSIYSMMLKASISFIIVSCIGQLQWSWFSRGRPLYDLVQYDNASRGAWGSIQLLWSQRLSQPLTTLSGFIFILSLGIDPSIQQLMKPSDCSVSVSDGKAVLPRTNKIGVLKENTFFNDDINLAIRRGFSGSGSGIYYDCTTGNCSFPDYGTIGYCSFCEDISNEITIDTFNSSVPDSSCPGPMTDSTIKSSLPINSYATSHDPSQLDVSFNFSTCPSVDYLWASNGTFELAKMDVLGNYPNYSIPGAVTAQILAGKTYSSDKHTDESTGQIIPGCQNDLSNSWRCRQYGAATCTLQPCVRVYNATVEAGHLTEHLIAHSGNLAWENDTREGGLIDTHCLTPEDKRTLEEQGYIVNEASRWLPYNTTDLERTSAMVEITNSLLRQKCLYLSSGLFHNIASAMYIYFIGTVEALPFSYDSSNFTLCSFMGLEILNHIYNSGHVNFNRVQGTFSNISESLTTYIRTYAEDTYSEPALGQAFHYATCIQVQWRWIAFPSSITLITLALFIATLYSRPLGHFPAWKTSFLPWMILGPGSAELLNSDELEETSFDIDDMEKKSREVTVTWKPEPSPHIEL